MNKKKLSERDIYSKFINMIINEQYYRKTQIEPEITQQCGQANFNGTKLASTIIPMPNNKTQTQVVSSIEQFFSIIEQSQALHTKLQLVDALVSNVME